MGAGYSGGWIYIFGEDENLGKPLGHQDIKMLGIGRMDAVFGLRINASIFKWDSSSALDMVLLVIN